jgi:NOL1/NOP2/sun family putative RNA methylase
MSNDLPSQFEPMMEHWLGAEWRQLRDALDGEPWRAIRLHRVSPNAAVDPLDHPAVLASGAPPLPVPNPVREAMGDPVPWMPDAFYISSESKLGKSVYHEAGAFYIQEPSAMAAVAALNPQPGETVLDLCAAPGGKTTAISRWMGGQGVLVANEIHPSRVVVLAQNLERLGVSAVVVNEAPDRLADALPGRFDAVLVDAPCSGEGMFRKDPESRAQWTPDAPEKCAARQRDILTRAVQLTREGGRVVYSTCTFNPEENERVIAWALNSLPVEIIELPLWPGWEPARPDWADGEERLQHARRLWPHTGRGEGHFVAALRVVRENPAARNTSPPRPLRASGKALQLWRDFLSEILHAPAPESWNVPCIRGSVVFAAPDFGLPGLDRLKVLRPGIALAHEERGRFVPHHHLAMALHPTAPALRIDLTPEQASMYLAGESLPGHPQRGWGWVNVEGLPLGWGKSVPGRVNNLYPKGLRRGGCTWTNLA